MDKGVKNQELWEDSAYTGEEQEKTLKKYEMVNQIHEKGSRNHLLTEKQKQHRKVQDKSSGRTHF